MEMKLLDSLGAIDNNFAFLPDDEYAYLAGARIVIRPCITKVEKENKYLEAKNGHFTKFTFNPLTNQFITCEVSLNTVLNIKVYLYSKENGFVKQTETTIKNCSEVTDLDITRDGTRLCVMLPEPYLCLKIYEIINDFEEEVEGEEEEEEEEQQQQRQSNKICVLKEILSIPLEVSTYTKCKFNPLKKNFIFMLSQRLCTLIEILDSFPEGYQPFELREDFSKEFKIFEDKKLTKRFEVYHMDASHNIDDYIDFCWARYNQIYISYSSGEVYLYDLIRRMINIREKRELIEDKDPDRIEDLSNTVHSMILTQRYLICAQENGKIALVNMFLSENDFKECRSSLGGAEMYRMFHVDNELEVTKMVQSGEYVTSMRYNNDYQKILAKTNFNNLYCLVLKAEILITNQEAQTDSDNTSKEIYNFEELKYHNGRIFGVKVLGETSEVISISEEDKRVIFWDVGKKQATTSQVLEFTPTCFETNPDGNLLIIASNGGAFRIYDITRRASINLIYQMKFNYKSSDFINRIVVHPNMKFIAFYKKGDRYIYFVSGEVSRKFAFLGYLRVPTGIIDISINNVQGEDFSTDPITIGSIVVLVRGMMLLYNIGQFYYDNKECWDIRKEKTDDVFSRFELKVEPKARKVDGDLNLIFKNCSTKPLTHIWLSGTDKMIRIFPLPVDKLDVVKESKKPIETPEEIKSHDLDVVCGNVYDHNTVITAGKDGIIHYLKDKKLAKKFRTHSYSNGGISNFYYNEKRKIIYTCGFDSSISILGLDEDIELPASEIASDLMSPMDSLESVEFLSDELCKNFVEFVSEQHQALIKTAKRQNQSELNSKLDEIKTDQAKLFLDNSKLEKHEQLKEEDMIVDKEKIKYEEEKNVEACHNLTKKRFEEFSLMEMQKTVLLENTYNIMKESNDDANINNNIRLVFNSNASRELRTFPLPNFSEKMKNNINHTKQLRLIQKMEEYKNRNNGQLEVIHEKGFSTTPEDYIVNRVPSMPVIVEKEVLLLKNGQEEGISKEIIVDDKVLGNVAKYKLQRNPYEEVNKKGDGDGPDLGIKGPDEQIYKEDRQLEYRTMLEINKNIPDVEFKSDLEQISSFTLLYSPFELYTNIRIRSQIYLLTDVIHQMKKNFNNDFGQYITERNHVLEKFNTNKSAIESIREILPDIIIPEYTYAFNPHEDNEWIEKFDVKEIKVPKYYSKEEKKQMQDELKAEEERLKALQGDTLQMRGLHHMIDNKVKSSKKNQSEEAEIVREPWMNKKKEEMTEEQLKIFLEFQRKEIEIREQKEKIRSQNLTKLNFHKSEIENNQMDLDMKFAKILRRKLHYDTLIAEEEIYILALIRLLQRRKEIDKTKKKIEAENKSSEELESKMAQKRTEFGICLNILESPQVQEEEKKNPRDDDKKYNFKDEIKNLFTILDPKRNDAYLKKMRHDPYYFDEKERLEHSGKYGDKEYDEIPVELIKQFSQNQRASQQQKNTQQQQEKAVAYFNKKYYLDYKKKQYEKHYEHLNNEYEQIDYKSRTLQTYYKQLENEIEKMKLNFNIMIRCRRGQDEVTDDKFIMPKEKEFRLESSPNNEILQEMNQEEEQEVVNQEPVDKFNLGIPLENCLLVDCTDIDSKNDKLQSKFNEKIDKQNLNKKQMQEKQYLTLENSLLQVSSTDIELKMKYLKLTRVTKKIQEIVTGKEEVNQLQIAKLYEDKKKNLEENTNKRLEALESKLNEIICDIKKKDTENEQFTIKLEKLKEDVGKTRQILDLDQRVEESDEYGDDDLGCRANAPERKTLEIAEVSKLKSLVKNYYEEIEYLRAELDKLRARTFPSFLQKPDNVIYPDEKEL